MKNLPFVLWMLFFPIMGDIGELLQSKAGTLKKHSESTVVIVAFINLFIYFFVGYLLYEGGYTR